MLSGLGGSNPSPSAMLRSRGATHGTALLRQAYAGHSQHKGKRSMAEGPAKALAQQGNPIPVFPCYSVRMYYVYLLRSKKDAPYKYIGFTEDLQTRIADHNEGKNPSTAP
jgi:hypothetical protein